VLVNAYFATGAADWYAGSRHASLVEGFRRGCADAGAAWGGGESPTLSGLVDAREIDLAGSAIGLVPAGKPALGAARLIPGDEIVLVASSGLHANGASLVRQLAPSLANGLLTRLPSGRAFGDATLDPSLLYVSLVEAIYRADLPLHYASHITGHGLRKVMRADRELTYRIHQLPPVPEVLTFLADAAQLSAEQAYGTLNMGVGFTLFCAAGAGVELVELARALGHLAIVGGVVEEGPRQVILEPLGVTYSSDALDLR
jgi:phosphoribosylformylglycinamidine cyclo-ligase